MIVESFQVKSDQKVSTNVIFPFGDILCTGFLMACWKNNIEVVKLLVKLFPKIIYQRNDSGETGFMIACARNNVATA